MSEAIDIYVLDTSAWLTLIEDEPGSDVVQEILEKARTGQVVVLVSFLSFMEVYYITLQERDQSEAQARVDLMAALPVLRVESTVALGIVAGELKANHRLSVADAWIAALTKERNATLVHKDPDDPGSEAALQEQPLRMKTSTNRRWWFNHCGYNSLQLAAQRSDYSVIPRCLLRGASFVSCLLVL